MAAVKFTIPPDLEYVKEVAEGTTEQEELQSFILRQGPYCGPGREPANSLVLAVSD